MRIFIVILSVLYSSIVYSQSAHKLLQEGDMHYKNEQYELAEEAYRKAKDKGNDDKAAYNLGNTLYEQGRYEEALRQYQNSIGSTTDPEMLSEAYYNLGNAHVQNKKLGEGIEAYKKALELNPNDNDAIANLFNTKLMMQQQQQQQQQQKQQDQDQQENQENQENQQQQQQQEQQQEQDQQEQQEEQQDSQEGENESESEEQKPQEEKKDLDKEDARKLLEIIDNEEKKVQEKLRKVNGKGKKPEKDW